MLFSHACKMSGEGRFHGEGEHRDAVFVAFPFPYGDHGQAEIEHFDLIGGVDLGRVQPRAEPDGGTHSAD